MDERADMGEREVAKLEIVVKEAQNEVDLWTKKTDGVRKEVRIKDSLQSRINLTAYYVNELIGPSMILFSIGR
jgi:hypothetical protein